MGIGELQDNMINVWEIFIISEEKNVGVSLQYFPGSSASTYCLLDKKNIHQFDSKYCLVT
jgi:hypothetical protein